MTTGNTSTVKNKRQMVIHMLTHQVQTSGLFFMYSTTLNAYISWDTQLQQNSLKLRLAQQFRKLQLPCLQEHALVFRCTQMETNRLFLCIHLQPSHCLKPVQGSRTYLFDRRINYAKQLLNLLYYIVLGVKFLNDKISIRRLVKIKMLRQM